jgi:hypothetical protein
VEIADIFKEENRQAMNAVRRQSRSLRSKRPDSGSRFLRRLGAATLDYVLVMGAVLPMVAMSYYYASRIIRAVYQMTCALVCWPFM